MEKEQEDKSWIILVEVQAPTAKIAENRFDGVLEDAAMAADELSFARGAYHICKPDASRDAMPFDEVMEKLFPERTEPRSFMVNFEEPAIELLKKSHKKLSSVNALPKDAKWSREEILRSYESAIEILRNVGIERRAEKEPNNALEGQTELWSRTLENPPIDFVLRKETPLPDGMMISGSFVGVLVSSSLGLRGIHFRHATWTKFGREDVEALLAIHDHHYKGERTS